MCIGMNRVLSLYKYLSGKRPRGMEPHTSKPSTIATDNQRYGEAITNTDLLTRSRTGHHYHLILTCCTVGMYRKNTARLPGMFFSALVPRTNTPELVGRNGGTENHGSEKVTGNPDVPDRSGTYERRNGTPTTNRDVADQSRELQSQNGDGSEHSGGAKLKEGNRRQSVK